MARYTAEQCAAAEAVGTLRTEDTFGDDTSAWHEYQNTVFRTLSSRGEELPPVGDRDRAERWKATRRQHGKIVKQSRLDAVDDVSQARQVHRNSICTIH